LKRKIFARRTVTCNSLQKNVTPQWRYEDIRLDKSGFGFREHITMRACKRVQIVYVHVYKITLQCTRIWQQ